jgi:fatty-acyl-CoA synthase
VTTFWGPPSHEEPGIGALTLPGLLNAVSTRHGDQEAVVFPAGGERLSFSDLRRRAGTLAKGLLASGLSKGTRVAVLLPNRPEWVVAAFGITMAGGVMVPLNTWFQPPELDYVLRHCDASFLISQDHLLHRDYAGELRELLPELGRAAPLQSTRFPFLRHVILIGRRPDLPAVTGWDDLLARAGAIEDGILHAAMTEVTPPDDAVIIYTSGSAFFTTTMPSPSSAGDSPGTSASTPPPAPGAPFPSSGRPASP